MTNLIESAAELRYRIDSFRVPAASRAELEATMRRNMRFIASLPGFRGHLVFEKVSGPGTFDLVTIAAWASPAAHAAAVARVRAYYAEIGFDPRATMARLGVAGELADFDAPPALQIA